MWKNIPAQRLAMLAMLAAVGLAPARTAVAQDGPMKTVAVVSVSSYEQLLGDLDYVGQQVERPGLPQMAEGLLAAMTAGRGTIGLDKTRPWGVVVQTDNQQFEPLAFVPVKDLQAIITTVATATGTEPQKNEQGIYELKAGEQTIFVQEQNGWAYIARSAEALGNVPADPVKLLDGLNEQYDVAARVYVQNIPEVFRNLAVQQLQQGVEMGLDRLPDEDEQAYQMRKQLVQNQMKQVTQLIEETETVTLGWAIVPAQEKTFVDLSIVALPGTKLAKQAAQLSQSKTNFAGFMTTDAAIRGVLSSQTVAEEDIAQTVAMVDALRARANQALEEDAELESEEARQAVKTAVGGFLDVLRQTAEEGKIDAGLLLKLQPDALTMAAGGYVADAAPLEDALRQLEKAAETDPDFEGVEWNVAEHEGVTFHRMQAPVEEEDAQKLLGEKVDLVVGIGKKAFYVALGKNSLETLKTVIDQSKANAGQAVPPFKVVVSTGDLVRFAAEQNDADPNLARVAEALSGADAQDDLTFTLTAIPNGVRYHVEVEQGVLQAIGKASAPVAPAEGEGDDF